MVTMPSASICGVTSSEMPSEKKGCAVIVGGDRARRTGGGGGGNVGDEEIVRAHARSTAFWLLMAATGDDSTCTAALGFQEASRP